MISSPNVKENSNYFLAWTLYKGLFSSVCILEVLTPYQSDYKAFPLQVISKNKNITKIFINVWNKTILTEQSFKYKDHRMGDPSLSYYDAFQEASEPCALPLPFFIPSSTQLERVLSKWYWVTNQ